MQNWKSLYNITFDKCQRTFWNCYYSNNPVTLAYSSEETEEEYERRADIDLFKVSSSLANTSFKNVSGEIKFFANAELQSILSPNILDSLKTKKGSLSINPSDIATNDFPFYNLYVGQDLLNYQNADITQQDFKNLALTTNEAIDIRERLIRCYPRKILYQDSIDNYILKNRPDDTMIPVYKSVELEVNNVMIVSTPDLSYKFVSNLLSNNELKEAYVYVNSYRESLGAVNDYLTFFQNAQHRLPPVSYKHKLLNSDYATFIYGNCKKIDAIQNYISDDASTEIIEYNYNNVPGRISFVWGNSQVTRIETIGKDSPDYLSKLYWNKSAFNEYTSEVGSVYNYTDSQHVTNVVTMDVGSITDRQCVLLPVVSSPLEYESRSAENGIIKVIDNIIATSALGYNTLGYPKNGILSYNTNGNISINSKLKNYIYIEQSNDTNECILGATIQKPVFTDVIHQHYRSLPETISFLPNPNYSSTLNLIDLDVGVQTTIGGNYNESDTASEAEIVLFYGDEDASLNGLDADSVSNLKKTLFRFYSPINNANVYNYPDDNSIWTLTDENNENIRRNVTFFMNPYSITATSGENGVSIIDLHEVNVFYDESALDLLSANVSGSTVTTSLTTLNCFDYEGNLIPIIPNTNGLDNSEDNLNIADGVGATYGSIISSYQFMITNINRQSFYIWAF